jgi:flagellar motility protein MotE (MotC chaperone)
MSPSRQAARATRTPPPSLTPGALANELREANRRRFEELAELQRERVQLELLRAEIASARRELARESAQLDDKAARLEREAAKLREATRPLHGDSPAAPVGAEPGPTPAQVEALARTLKGMKPEQAAALVGRLERTLAVAVLSKLRPSDAAGVLGRMPSGNAAELFTLMARNGAARK